MTFQEIDFHIELFKGYLEPKEAQFSYLDLVRKKSGYSKDAFFAKLDQAFDNLSEAWEDFHSLRTSNTIGDKNIGLPISGFNRYPVLLNFSMTFQGLINKGTIEDLSKLIVLYKINKRLKSVIKRLPEESKVNSVTSHKESNFKSLESIWMTDPKKTIEQVIEKGFGLGLWNEKNRLQSEKGGLYGSGKSLLSGLYFSLKGNSIKGNIDYKEVGKVLCEFFEVTINEKTSEPFKPFQKKNEKITKEFQKTLRI
jgi:hypothetical protein